MVKLPRSHERSEPDEALDLLRALARQQRESDHADDPAQTEAPPPPESEADKMEALRALAQKLDHQLRTPAPPAAEAPPPRPAPRGAALSAFWKRLMARATALASASASATRRHLSRLHGYWLHAQWLHRREVRLAALGAMALVAGAALGLLIWHLAFPEQTAVLAPAPTATPTPRAPREAPVKADIAAISKAMSDCDAAAAQDQGALYFLILPMVPAGGTERTWAAQALQTVGNSFILLSSKDALEGLANNTLMLRPGRYTFAIVDSESGASYSWTSATGLARLTKREAGATKMLKLGFDFSEAQTGAQWTSDFQRERGACYWVSALVRE